MEKPLPPLYLSGTLFLSTTLCFAAPNKSPAPAKPTATAKVPLKSQTSPTSKLQTPDAYSRLTSPDPATRWQAVKEISDDWSEKRKRLLDILEKQCQNPDHAYRGSFDTTLRLIQYLGIREAQRPLDSLVGFQLDPKTYRGEGFGGNSEYYPVATTLVSLGYDKEVNRSFFLALGNRMNESTLRAMLWVWVKELGRSATFDLINNRREDELNALKRIGVVQNDFLTQNLERAETLLIYTPDWDDDLLIVRPDPMADDVIKYADPILADVQYPGPKRGAPATEFSAVDMNGKTWKLSDFPGKKFLVLTFFPKTSSAEDDKQLISLREHQAEFEAKGIQVLAISVDPADGLEGQLAFAKRLNLTFPLIPDTSRTLSQLYGAANGNTGTDAQVTFVIGLQGEVAFIFRDEEYPKDGSYHLNPATLGADILAHLKDMGYIR